MKLLKKFCFVLLIFMLPCTVYAANTYEIRVTIGENSYILDGKTHSMDAAAYISPTSNSTMVPVRFVANAFGLGNDQIIWNDISKTTTIDAPDKVIEFTLNSSTMKVNGSPVKMLSPDGKEVKAEIKTVNGSGRMYLPFRVLGEGLGVSVDWDSQTRTAIYKKTDSANEQSTLTPTRAPTSAPAQPAAPTLSNNEAALPDQFIFIYKGARIVMNEDTTQLFADIGQPDKTFESPSCAFDGVDKILYYNGFNITTYPDKDRDRIKSITLTDQSVQTPEGTKLGMRFNDMVNVYGDTYGNTLDLYFYVIGDIKLSLLFEDGILVDISYYYLPVTNLEQ
ncbi:MAG: copper amine oxidase N-terminal domain-containing protein [Clostridiales bacterium]|nr:copper amine oxidase N-terminal domain-containing protein [Clostridiales bacterium]